MQMIPRALLLSTASAVYFAALPGWVSAVGTVAPDFELPRRGMDQKVRLQELRGKIIVLDFFAHWCVPCLAASTEVENKLRQYYAKQKVNAHGIPVTVFAVNVEAERPEKTEAFIKRAGLETVLEDLDGKVFQLYGGSSLPFLVVIDATSGNEGNTPPRIAYRKPGFEGVTRLRHVIDDIVGELAAPDAAARSSSETTVIQAETPKTRTRLQPIASSEATPLPTGGHHLLVPRENGASETRDLAVHTGESAVHKVGLDFGTLFASDILLTDEIVEYRQTRLRSELALSVSHGYIGLHYVPESILEQNNDVENHRFGFQTTGRFQVCDRVTLLGYGGAYDGYQDYRSLWLDEHFRQVFSGRQGYEKAHPWGGSVSGGLRWEYLPASGFVQGDLIYQHDIISPGYDVSLATFPPRLIRFRDKYDTLSGRLNLENVLTRRLRVKQEFQITDTTNRELRFAFQSSLNLAFAEHWVARLTGGYTKEEPQLEAWHGSMTVERDWNETWFFSVMGRYYTDTGQIENALLAENTASPPLEAFQLGLGLRWQGFNSSAKLIMGPYFTRYDSTANAANLFGRLYHNRDWLSVQFAFAREF